MNTIERNHSVSDAEMIDAARRHYSQYSNYAGNFSTLDGDVFDENFIVNFGALISKAASIPADEALLGELMSETQDLTDVRKDCVDHLGGCKYYIKKASKGDKGFMKQFLYSELDGARNSTVKMTQHMQEFVTVCSAKEAALIAAGMPEHFFERGEALAAAIVKEKSEQDQAKINRTDKTKLRVQTLNQIWDTMVVLSDANQYANPGDETAKEIFSLPYPTEKADQEEN